VSIQALPNLKWGRYGKRPLVVLCLVGLVDAIDRGVLPAVLESIQGDLHFSDFQGGLLNTALILSAVLLAVPGGLLSDRTDRRILMGAVLAVWSVASALTSVVQSFGQLFAVRAALGAGEAINDPAAQSLVADYYPMEIRGRAYAWQRVVPTVGLGLAVGLPGLLVTLLVRRLPLPARGETDSVTASAPSESRWQDVKDTLSIPSIRVLLVSTAFINGILTAVGYWGIAYHVRASGFTKSSSPVIAGSVILLGAIAGGVAGGIAIDKLRGRVRGAAMLMSAVVTASGGTLLFLSFLDGIPVFAVRLPLQMVGVALVVSALPPLTVITAEVVPPALRGTSFGLVKLFANVLGAVFPPIIGAIADSHRIRIHTGEIKGDLGMAFRFTIPIMAVGSAVLLLGRRHLDADTARALASD
jgi:MFS family permease